MYGRLGYEAIRSGYANKSRNERGNTQKEEVVMETWWLAKRKLRSLRNEGLRIINQMKMQTRPIDGESHRNIVVEEEKDPQNHSEWKRNADPLAIKLPKSHKPFSSIGSLECTANRQRFWICNIELSPIRHPRCCDQRYGHPIIGEEAAYVTVEIRRFRKLLEKEGGD